ncbi:helix-turn-helix transcriptional regulator [Shewanella algae]|uniref:helix-turn-helix transcriptional regulator n=1 Tax=Shewanella algae TaxID=38313 RepID=UPI001F2C03B8|nr:helix-turn-helix transcriptional regulator [Shewanella algae]MCE9785569.1 helix-turn-helix domain containing protein [Shewanella algae]
MKNFVKLKMTKFRLPLNEAPDYEGGKVVIERLISLFGVRNRIELAEILGVSPGTFATWQTRNTTPFELLTRIHLATGVSMEYLLFGGDDDTQDVMKYGEPIPKPSYEIRETAKSYRSPAIKCYSIETGELISNEEFAIDEALLKSIGATGSESDMLLVDGDSLLFINSKANKAINGQYLFSVNDSYQVGELRLLPDGKVYLFHNGGRFEVDHCTTTVHGKVVSILERC